jgi:hypothetical protein
MLRVADRPAIAAACVRVAEREAFLALVLAMLVVFLLRLAPHQLVADSWLALVAGREVVAHGLPARDTLTIWTDGVEWIDQQWLAHVVLYGLAAVGGLKLALVVNVSVIGGSFAAAAIAARRFGASARSVAFTALPCIFASVWAYQLRAQTLAYPLFIAVLWLLAADSRNPSRRVLLVAPILSVWANVHGSAALGAVLVCIYGMTVVGRVLARRDPVRTVVVGRAVAVTLMAPLCLFASPYGLSLIDYYRSVLANQTLSRLVVEWQPSTPSALTAVFFALAFATVWLVARQPGLLTPFERVALALTMLGGLAALRNIVWFAFTALMLLPVLVDAVAPVREAAKRRLSVLLASAAAAGIVAVAADAARLPESWYTNVLPAQAATAVAQAAATDPDLRIFATEPYADWLLWERPELARRIAFDVRFELLSEPQFRSVLDLYELRRRWRRPVRGYGLVVLEPTRKHLRHALLAERGARVLYAGPKATVVFRDQGR